MAAEKQLVPMPQSGCFIIQLRRRVVRVYWLGYLPGIVFRERVSGASSLVCTGLHIYITANVPLIDIPVQEVCRTFVAWT